MNIDDHTRMFTEYLRLKDLKDRTVSNYNYYLLRFFTKYPKLNEETLLRAMSYRNFQNPEFRAFMRNYIEFVKVYSKDLDFTNEEYKDIIDIVVPKRSGRKKSRIIKPLSEDQILLMENHLKDEKLKIMLLLSFYCGLRLTELMNIRVLSFNWPVWGQKQEDYGELRVIGKGDKEGICIVPSKLMKRVGKYIKSKRFKETNDLLFTFNGKKVKNPFYIGRQWARRLRQAGIDARITKLDGNGEVIDDTEVHPHRLRHSYGYYLRNVKRMDITYIKELLRHSSISSTQIYTYTDKEDVKNELRRTSGNYI